VADADRTRRLEALGYRVIRFTNEDVFQHLEGVLAKISEALRNSPTPALRARPSRKREGK
jgi:very-short-patch-repair endonuclease